MKNVQIIDGADNCAFSIFQLTEAEFSQVFPGDSQDMEFAEDFSERPGSAAATIFLTKVWERPIRKNEVIGLHETLYFGTQNRRDLFPASKREQDWSASSLNPAQRRLYAGQPMGF